MTSLVHELCRPSFSLGGLSKRQLIVFAAASETIRLQNAPPPSRGNYSAPLSSLLDTDVPDLTRR